MASSPGDLARRGSAATVQGRVLVMANPGELSHRGSRTRMASSSRCNASVNLRCLSLQAGLGLQAQLHAQDAVDHPVKQAVSVAAGGRRRPCSDHISSDPAIPVAPAARIL
jgi:hypothetical protein